MASNKQSAKVGPELARVLPVLDKPWFRTPHLLKLNFLLLLVTLSATGMGFDGSMMNGLQSLSTWTDYFHNPTSYLLGITNAVLNLGPILFGGVVAWISDRFGRRITIQCGCLMIIFAATLQTASQNLGMFVAARFIVGVGIEFCLVPSPVLTTELAYPTHRAQVTSILFTFYFVGSILSSWTTYGTYRMNQSTWTWRIPSLLQVALPAVEFVGLFWVPESPRWLVSKGRIQEARSIFVKYHANGDELSPLVDFEMEEIHNNLRYEAGVSSSGWKEIWRTPADKKRLVLLIYLSFMTQWCGNNVISYYLSLILESVGVTSSDQKTLINGILQIVSWVAAVIGGLLVDRLGRRFLWLYSLTVMLLSYVIWTVCSALYEHSQSYGLAIAVLALIFLFQIHYSFGITPLSMSYPVEILPFHSRQKVLSLFYIGNSCANLFNNFVTPVALSAIHWKYYLVFIVVLTQFVIVVFLFFPETRGHGLEQISKLFDNDALFLGLTKVHDLGGNVEQLEKVQYDLKDGGIEQIETVETVNKTD